MFVHVTGPVARTDHEDPVQVKRAYKFLLRPTSKQVAAFEACLEDPDEDEGKAS